MDAQLGALGGGQAIPAQAAPAGSLRSYEVLPALLYLHPGGEASYSAASLSPAQSVGHFLGEWVLGHQAILHSLLASPGLRGSVWNETQVDPTYCLITIHPPLLPTTALSLRGEVQAGHRQTWAGGDHSPG